MSKPTTVHDLAEYAHNLQAVRLKSDRFRLALDEHSMAVVEGADQGRLRELSERCVELLTDYLTSSEAAGRRAAELRRGLL